MTSHKTWKNKLIKATVLTAGAALTMGNQKCENAQTEAEAPVRSLKKLVELGELRASPIRLPDGSAFDFAFVANQQIYDVLLNNSDVTLKYNPTIAIPPSELSLNSRDSFYNLTQADGKMMKTFSQAAGKYNYDVQYAKTAWCMVNIPQAKIAGSINAFEMTGGGGLTIGFNPSGSTTSPTIGGSFNVQSAQLDLSMVATRPLTTKAIASASVTAKQTKTNVSFGLNLGMFTIGPSYYYSTPLASVTKSALKKAVNTLNTTLAKEDWHTRVLANHDSHLVIVGGLDVKLEEGDELLVYNEDYYWAGEPCNSQYLGGGAAANAAVAKIRVDWVGDEISRGRVIEQNDENAVIGAKVKLYKYHAADYTPIDPGVLLPVGPVDETLPPIASKPGR